MFISLARQTATMQGAMPRALFVMALACAAAAAGKMGVSDNPLGEVITLLARLAEKITKDGEAEAKAYHEYFEWCDDTAKNAGFEIKTAAAKKEALEALIQKKAGDAMDADTKIEALAAGIAQDAADLKAATGVRHKEAADFSASEAELVEVITP